MKDQQCAPAVELQTTEPFVTDKRGFGKRWGLGPRMIDNLLAQGLPHCRIGVRRVRIIVAEADQWMREKYGTKRRGAVNSVAKVLHSSKTATSKPESNPSSSGEPVAVSRRLAKPSGEAA
ncbi:MAG TPA: hypothetical protein VFZ59_04530 [Verrucomicrobiae bacterium]|nr:hypothetical protein [Verrucomicrobiae bacterium]